LKDFGMSYLFRKIIENRSGVAALEFALVSPILFVFTLYGLELANLASVHLRISQVVNMTADNAARVHDRIDEVDINELFEGSRIASGNVNVTGHGRILLSVVEDNIATAGDTTDQIVTWQRCKGTKVPASTYASEGDVLTTGIGPAGSQISATSANPIIFAEVFYDYQPIIPLFFTSALVSNHTIRYAAAYTVRDRTIQAMQNGSNLAAGSQSLCSTYSAT
jgi:Flp pilus assembly protein TadG